MTVTGNDFALGEGIAFKQLLNMPSLSNYWFFPLIRLITVALAWTIKCLPYISFSILFTHVLSPNLVKIYQDSERKSFAVKLILGCLFPLVIGATFVVKISLLSLLLPYLTFLCAIGISNLISQNITFSEISLQLGYFSYGIYLSHALITAGFLPVVHKLYPEIISFQLSPLTLILSSLIIFTVSLIMTYLISLNKNLAKILLAA
jgi:peptidoglycan/LPS O-acetylase OafA/YrhL